MNKVTLTLLVSLGMLLLLAADSHADGLRGRRHFGAYPGYGSSNYYSPSWYYFHGPHYYFGWHHHRH